MRRWRARRLPAVVIAIALAATGSTVAAAEASRAPTLFAGARLVVDSGPKVVPAAPDPPEHASARQETAALRLVPDGEAGAAAGGLEARVVLSPLEGEGTRVHVEAKATRAAWVKTVAVELLVQADRAEVIGHDLVRRKVTAPLALGRFDPKRIELQRAGTPVATLLVDDGLDAVEVAPRGAVVAVKLVLFDTARRPFVHDARCARMWRDPNKRVVVPFRAFVAGDLLASDAVAVSPAAPAIVLERWPEGRRAAFVITDHADQSEARTLKPLVDGLVAAGLRITKALFARGGHERPQMEDARVQELAATLRAHGSEVVPHSATPRTDARDATEAALALFGHDGGHTLIDHQPETNCEAFGSSGWRVRGRFAQADLLTKQGYRYIWSIVDAPPGPLDLLGRADAGLWPLGRLEADGPSDLWMFRAMWSFVPLSQFGKMYGAASLDRFERTRGLHVAHTYLETDHKPGTMFGRRTLMAPAVRGGKPGQHGPVVLGPLLRGFLSALSARVARGTLWVPTLTEAGDRLRATMQVLVRPAPDDTVTITTPAPLLGATFALLGRHDAHPEVLEGATAIGGTRTDGEDTIFWLDLPAGTTRLRVGTETHAARLPKE